MYYTHWHCLSHALRSLPWSVCKTPPLSGFLNFLRDYVDLYHYPLFTYTSTVFDGQITRHVSECSIKEAPTIHSKVSSYRPFKKHQPSSHSNNRDISTQDEKHTRYILELVWPYWYKWLYHPSLNCNLRLKAEFNTQPFRQTIYADLANIEPPPAVAKHKPRSYSSLTTLKHADFAL